MNTLHDPICPAPAPLDPRVTDALQTPGREPAALLESTWTQWRQRRESGLWVFGYASLIWNPEVRHTQRLPARVHGYHRALRMWSRVNRGSPQVPGLVFALLPGGTCRGMVMHIEAAHARAELERLWQREMPTGVYDPTWLRCRTANGEVRALGFTLDRRSPNHTGDLDDETLLRILREARGRYGSTLDYVHRTHHCLHEAGIRDRALGRIVRLAHRHGLGG